uniref:ubiquitinyl hydrolase 1 n=1 Tax=Timema monikensis TaxID=170555 RepID=A0A7R9EHL4_9NEOP|nr:unnamed protein product [Timema monikensis]
MSCDSSTSKWACDYCTYENWPSSLKCTMCRGAKPLLGEDIYRLRDEPHIDTSCGLSLASGPSDSKPTRPAANDGKWECGTCTYMNWPRSLKCSQCYILRPASLSNLHEHLQPLRIEQSSDCTASGGLLRTSTSPTLDKKEAKDADNYVGGHRTKWLCVTCTYENWPKATKCIMCAASYSPANSIVSSPEKEIQSARATNQVSLVENANKRPALHHSERMQASAELGIAGPHSPNNWEYERRLKQIRRRMCKADWAWLKACMGVVDGDPNPVEAYLSSGGDPARQLTPSEAAVLNRPSAFDTGHTLVHLAIRFHREDMLATLLSQIEGSGSGVKRVPSYVAPDLAADIRHHMASTIRLRKGSLPCHFVTEITSFALPAEVEDLPTTVQEQLFEELLDKDAQQQLESDPPIINWSLEVTVRLGSRLYALWNRSAGDCLLDSAMQATWGVFDRDNTLRRALADSLHEGGHFCTSLALWDMGTHWKFSVSPSEGRRFYPRWKEYEASQARLLEFSLEEGQWEEDWAGLLSLASQPGSSLEQLHVFTLAHILRRPIIIYGVKYVKSFRGETIGFARFEGVYLPLLWEPSFCVRSPLALGYTRGHFSALVALEPYSRLEGVGVGAGNDLQVTFLPLMDCNRKILPVHFLTGQEVGRDEEVLRQWLDVCVTEGGVLVAQQRLHKRPLLVAQMVEEWLNHYRRLAQMTSAPFTRPAAPVQDYSSDGGDSDDE